MTPSKSTQRPLLSASARFKPHDSFAYHCMEPAESANGKRTCVAITTDDETFTAQLAASTEDSATSITKEMKYVAFKVSLIAFVLCIALFIALLIINMEKTQSFVNVTDYTPDMEAGNTGECVNMYNVLILKQTLDILIGLCADSHNWREVTKIMDDKAHIPYKTGGTCCKNAILRCVNWVQIAHSEQSDTNIIYKHRSSLVVWRQYCAEHGIVLTGKKSKSEYKSFLCFYEERDTGQFISRDSMVDLEPNVIDG